MSIVANHFPQIRWENGNKRLWNPIHRQKLKDRPEERIRLRIVEYLLDAGWSKHRISAEEQVSSSEKGGLRTDLICYTHDFDPFLLVECKAPNINISEQTAEQIARYNEQVKAPFLLISNGKTDLWYHFDGDNKPILQNDIPKAFHNSDPAKKSFTYWTKRGFTGNKAGPSLRNWLAETLKDLSKMNLMFLSFAKTLSDTDLNHYYSVHSFQTHRIALTFTGTAYGDTRLIAIINKGGKNTGVLEINLDLLFDDQTPNASLYNREGSKNIDLKNILNWEENNFQFESFSKKIYGWVK